MGEVLAQKAAFIGSGTLLVACAEIWAGKGNAIHGVVTSCPIATAWCERNGVPHIAPNQDQASWLGRGAFDYLFSVVNHAITPAAVLKLPARRAINYHDSPLPKYSGFNATSWAILNSETQHAVTWHAMTADVDGGDILLQQPIDILDEDVAYSLGAKCIEAGRESFDRLVDMLNAESNGATLPVRPQGPSESFHLRSDRPGLGIIDFSKTVQEIRNLVRATTLGSDDNWMCRAKLALPAGLFIVEQAEPVSRLHAAPGTIVAIDGQAIEIAAADGVLRFELATLEGASVDLMAIGARIGDVLAPQQDAASAHAADALLTKHERFWVDRLAAQRAPVVAGIKADTGTPKPAMAVRQLPSSFAATGLERRTALTAALLAYITRAGEDDSFDLALAKALPAGLGGAYASQVPFRVAIDKANGFGALVDQVIQEFTVQDKRGSYARDAVTRYQALRSGKPMPALTIGIQYAMLEGLTPASALSNGQLLSLIIPDDGASYAWAYDTRAIDSASFAMLADRFDVLLANGLRDGATPLNKLDILPNAERKLLLETWQDTVLAGVTDQGIHQMFDAQAARTPDAIALRFKNESLTYRQLAERADAVAEAIQSRGVAPGILVAVCMERSLDLVAGLLGVLKAGGAYVPLDPAYPRDRLNMMLEDSQAKVLLTQKRLSDLLPSIEAAQLFVEDVPARPSKALTAAKPAGDDLAYVIFTSGSTGRPKGVMLRHNNVANFFAGMDERIGKEPGVWLAVTSVSFDISVLEIFWTLTRGFEVVIQGESDRASIARAASVSALKQPMDFSLFYFAAGQGSAGPGGPYRLLLEGAKFADTHDFSAVWTPERHFHEFGGPYPNPAVTTAALATITSRVSLRAGSVVLPLHNPLRVAEDWSVIDQISGGRVGLSFASGWHADDFAFMPQNYERRREVMLESIDTVMKLWRGEKIDTVNGQGKTIAVSVLPRPVQAQPPMWIASAGSVDTFKVAGRIGANVLTNMLGQDIDDLRSKFAAYRDARREAGHEGPGTVTVMLHTFVCEDTEKARELARGPFCNYLKSSFDLIKVAPSMFPAFRQPSLTDGDGKGFDASRFTADDMEALMEHAFDRYFETAGLFGSPSKALAMVDRLKSIGATEVACLIDFGIDTEVVLESLPYLNQLRQMSNAANDGDTSDYSIPAQIRDRGVTHLQCTPSLARMIVSEPDGLAALGQLKRLLLGGEALPVDLSDLLTARVSGEIHNMYGPTETTIWSTTSRVRSGEPITIGKPIANTVIRILNEAGQVAPIGVAAELYIGGAGVAAGYLNRPDLTADRFVADPYGSAGPLYRTGDLARYTASGDIEFLGRTDFQVKLNGYRIELGEIEAALGRHDLVGQSVVAARTDDGVTKLVAYVTPLQQSASANISAEQVTQWGSLWDSAYRESAGATEPRFNTAGWNDSATGMPIPREQMREWLDGVERSILELKPKRVLEVGFGTGMVLYRVLPHVEHYTGVDLSAHAVEAIRNELTPEEQKRVSLHQQAAHALDGVADRSCDTVIINSVSQYFPDAAYLEKVLRRASEIVSDGGSIFVGDVRSLEQFEAFHTNVALRQVPEGSSAADIAQRIDRRIAQDGELVIGEAFFHALIRDLPRASSVNVRLKPGVAHNEMSDFRYDVVIRFGNAVGKVIKPVVIARQDLEASLGRSEPAVVVRDIVNARVAGIHAARAILVGSGQTGLSALRAAAEAQVSGAVEPTSLAALNPDYDVQVVPARSGDPARFDAVFRSRNIDPAVTVDAGAPAHDNPALQYARGQRAPEAGVLSIDDLRTYLRGALPEYMIPSAFVVLDAFPLTPNGKIDRKALPRPTQAVSAAVETAAYVAPSNSIEETISDVWKGILGITRVGLKENIFDLGANSLLTVQANQRLSGLLGRKIALVSMFRYPTVEALAAHLSEGQVQAEPSAKRMQERDAKKKDAAERRRELRANQQ